MIHTLLEQLYPVKNYNDYISFMEKLLKQPHNADGTRLFYLNSSALSKINFLCQGGNPMFSFSPRSTNSSNRINGLSSANGNIFYHISSAETVKYFTMSISSETNQYTYILAQDENDEWVVFNADKMYSDYGATGIYNNPQIGRSEVVDGENQFMISKALRLDTGAEFKELHFVLSAKSYSDTNCIVSYGGKTYRFVSVSNTKDETGRYPAFAFPVSD